MRLIIEFIAAAATVMAPILILFIGHALGF